MSDWQVIHFLKSIANSILRTLFRPILKDLQRVEERVANLTAQVDHLIQVDVKAEVKSRHQAIDDKQDLHTRLLNEANDKHNSQLNYLKHTYQNQNFSLYAHFGEALRPDFHAILHQVLGNDFPTIQQHAEQLFTDILISHLRPGGIWRLQHDISQFTKSPAPPPDLSNASFPTGGAPTSLKICIISGCFPSLMHGGGGRLLDIITELATDHNIDLFTHFNPGLDTSSLELIKGKLDHIKLVEDYESLTVAAVESWLRSINRDLGYYDVIQLEYPQTIHFITPLRKYGKRIGFTFMECLAKSHTEKLQTVLETADYEHISSQATAFWTALADERYALDNADFCIAVTDDDAHFLQRLSPHPTHIVPTCLSRYSITEAATNFSDMQPKEHSVMFVGFFGHWPNIEAMEWYLTAIHPLVKAAVPDYHFTIVGSGDVTKLIRLCAGDKTVAVTGQVESIVPYILKAKVCISPLVSGAGIRGKQNQYAALGRPSVTTSIGNNGLPYTHGESVMIADNASDFAKSIIALLTDETLYNTVQKQAQSIALDNYTWPKHLETLLTLYRGVF